MDSQLARWLRVVGAIAAGAVLVEAIPYLVQRWLYDTLPSAGGVVLGNSMDLLTPYLKNALKIAAACIAALAASELVSQRLLQGRRFIAVGIPIAATAAVVTVLVSDQLPSSGTPLVPDVLLAGYDLLLMMVPPLVAGVWLLRGGTGTARPGQSPAQFDGIWEAPSHELHLLPDGTFALLETGAMDEAEAVEGTWAVEQAPTTGRARILLESDTTTPLGAGWQLTTLSVDYPSGRPTLHADEGPAFTRAALANS